LQIVTILNSSYTSFTVTSPFRHRRDTVYSQFSLNLDWWHSTGRFLLLLTFKVEVSQWWDLFDLRQLVIFNGWVDLWRQFRFERHVLTLSENTFVDWLSPV
jgi:hypothetical protein